jgi:uncharacterized membrane protein YgcG
MCSVYTQTEDEMVSAVRVTAVRVKYERKLEFKNERIWELEKELEVSKRMSADLMIKINSLEEQVKYAEKPVVSWCDQCARKKPLPAVTNLVGKLITDRDAKNSDAEATTGRSTECDRETPTETESRQRHCANLDEQKTERIVPQLVENYERMIRLLNEQTERLLHDKTSLIQDIKRRFDEENQRQVQKMCEVTWYKEQLLASLCREGRGGGGSRSRKGSNSTSVGGGSSGGGVGSSSRKGSNSTSEAVAAAAAAPPVVAAEKAAAAPAEAVAAAAAAAPVVAAENAAAAPAKAVAAAAAAPVVAAEKLQPHRRRRWWLMEPSRRRRR